jgi:hypothetical protein
MRSDVKIARCRALNAFLRRFLVVEMQKARIVDEAFLKHFGNEMVSFRNGHPGSRRRSASYFLVPYGLWLVGFSEMPSA